MPMVPVAVLDSQVKFSATGFEAIGIGQGDMDAEELY